ncbi:hypothetical protein AOLI_G00068310 [Acnodon oligacanthus]
MRSVFHIVEETHRSLSSLSVWGLRVSLTVTVRFNEITHTAALSAPTPVQPQWAASEQMLLLLNKASAVDSSLAHTKPFLKNPFQAFTNIPLLRNVWRCRLPANPGAGRRGYRGTGAACVSSANPSAGGRGLGKRVGKATLPLRSRLFRSRGLDAVSASVERALVPCQATNVRNVDVGVTGTSASGWRRRRRRREEAEEAGGGASEGEAAARASERRDDGTVALDNNGIRARD